MPRAAQRRHRQHPQLHLGRIGVEIHIVGTPAALRRERHADAFIRLHHLAKCYPLQLALGHPQGAVVHHCLALHKADTLPVEADKHIARRHAHRLRHAAQPHRQGLRHGGRQA
ncbi:MAG: hypothetical protein J6V98_01530, partial [Bacteroidales bacterium]|nr:hypothetical protein [Bacteroidales bacterium]